MAIASLGLKRHAMFWRFTNGLGVSCTPTGTVRHRGLLFLSLNEIPFPTMRTHGTVQTSLADCISSIRLTIFAFALPWNEIGSLAPTALTFGGAFFRPLRPTAFLSLFSLWS